MENETFRNRLTLLIQKCRKAVRLYTNMGRRQQGGGDIPDHHERQLHIWREVNADLLKQLMAALEASQGRSLVNDLFSIRDRYYHLWRDTECDLRRKQRELILAAENEDFVKASLLSPDLVVLKARMQACQAAHHELQDVVARSRALVKVAHDDGGDVVITETSGANDSSPPQVSHFPNVIPLRR